MTHSAAVIKRVADAVKVARLFGVPVFHTEQAPEKLGPTVAPIREALGTEAPPARLLLEFSKAGLLRVERVALDFDRRRDRNARVRAPDRVRPARTRP